MSNYLQLVNKAIEESSAETNTLTLDTWDQPEAGRRLYPRIKRFVAEAWKMIQMDRDEWEFKSSELTTLIVPRLKVAFGSQPAGISPVGLRFTGQESGFSFVVVREIPTSGNLEDGDWFGQYEISAITGPAPVMGEIMRHETAPDVWQFSYRGPGNYDLKDIDPTLRQIKWDTLVATNLKGGSIPLHWIPYINWENKTRVFGRGQLASPVYATEDLTGKLVFNPNFAEPFRLTVEYDTSPQILTLPTDVPFNLNPEYHDWIAWQAVLQLALYDKNSQLANYASPYVDFYSRRAEKELLPVPKWGNNGFY